MQIRVGTDASPRPVNLIQDNLDLETGQKMESDFDDTKQMKASFNQTGKKNCRSRRQLQARNIIVSWGWRHATRTWGRGTGLQYSARGTKVMKNINIRRKPIRSCNVDGNKTTASSVRFEEFSNERKECTAAIRARMKRDATNESQFSGNRIRKWTKMRWTSESESMSSGQKINLVKQNFQINSFKYKSGLKTNVLHECWKTWKDKTLTKIWQRRWLLNVAI